MEFLAEADRLKSILRKTKLIGEARYENSAEHSWHFALMAFTLCEHARETINVHKVVQMALIHDLVEIDAGDTFVYDSSAMKSKAALEIAAAERIFGLLPEDQAASFRALWDEFEAQETPESQFAAAIDRLCGLLPNYRNAGGSWKEHKISAEQVQARNHAIGIGSPALWEIASGWIQEATEKGWIQPA
jgi:putative hydrolases of HD superfamily